MKELISTDGRVLYESDFLSMDESQTFLTCFLNTFSWEADRVKIFGKEYVLGRKSVWFALDGKSYTYAGYTRNPQPFPPILLQLMQRIEEKTNHKFDSCLANLYRNGQDAMGYHSDAEKELDSSAAIASISLGEERKFLFRHNQTKLKTECLLEDGSLLLMLPPLQQFWKHALPKSAKKNGLRINLTFRKMR